MKNVVCNICNNRTTYKKKKNIRDMKEMMNVINCELFVCISCKELMTFITSSNFSDFLYSFIRYFFPKLHYILKSLSSNNYIE